MQNKLDLVLTHKWFDLIKSGQKTIEYRRKTPYWERRLKGFKSGDTIVFRRGYTNTTLTAIIVKITPYGYSALPQDVQDFMTGIQSGRDLFYAIEFKLLEDKDE